MRDLMDACVCLCMGLGHVQALPPAALARGAHEPLLQVQHQGAAHPLL